MYRKILEIQDQGHAAVLVTITKATGSIPREIGAKLLITEEDCFGNLGGGALEWLAIEKARALLDQLKHSRNLPSTYSQSQLQCGGIVELFFDIIHPKPQLLIFGAGAITQGLLEILSGTAFECTVVDSRPLWIEATQKKKFQFSQLSLKVVESEPVQWVQSQKDWNWSLTYCLILTHEQSLDEELLGHLIEQPTYFLGMLGSRSKRETYLEKLKRSGVLQSRLDQVICPLGLRIGGKNPKEIALSIAAQLVHVYHHGAVQKVEDGMSLMSHLESRFSEHSSKASVNFNHSREGASKELNSCSQA